MNDQLQKDVHDRPDHHRADHREGDVASGVRGLAAELDRLLEALVGEDHAAGRDGGEDPVDAGRREAVAGAEIGALELGDAKTMIVKNGIAIFHQTIAVFAFASRDTP